MNTRRIIIGAVLVFIGLPVVLVLTAVLSFYVLNRTNGTIVSSGQRREYLLYVPRSYDRAKPTPLVICMHGATGWPALQMSVSGWNRLADEHGFVVVYPSGTGVPKSWDMQADVRFISELIDTLEAGYNIDRTRIYANGFSNGGAMANALSCTLSHRIAAVGTVSAANRSSCPDARPLPMITFLGTADPWERGRRRPFPNVATWTANWARRNRCGPNPSESVVAVDVTRLEYTDCADDAVVVLYTVRGGGHQWFGGKPLPPEWLLGPYNHSIDATSLTWAFFREHRLSTKWQGRVTDGRAHRSP